MLTDLRSRPEGCVSDLEFDEWRAGEVEPARLGEFERHLASCERCRERRQLLERDAQAFLERAPARNPPSTGKSPGRKKMAARWAVGAGAAVTLAAAAGVVLLARPSGDVDGTRLKGSGAHIGFFVKRGTAVQRGADGERVHPRDQLRFTVTTIHPSFVAILSLDARGVASVYYPPTGASQSVNAGSDLALEGSVELDDTLGEERLYGLFCDAPIDVEAARMALARTGTKPSGIGCTTDSLRVLKERP